MTDTILAIDIGTSSLKAALLPDNLFGRPIFVSRQFFSPAAKAENQGAGEWLPALKAALSELKEKNTDYGIEAVCISGNGPTLVTDDGKTFMYDEPLPDFSDFLPESGLSALQKTKSLFLPRLCAFKKLFPDSCADSEHIFGAPEFLIYALTGANLTILPEKRFELAYWNQKELESCGFTPDEIKKIPPYLPAGAFAGKISEKAALKTGLLEGTLVFAGAPDFVVALIGTGAVLPGRLCDRAGTSEGLNLCTAKPVFAEGLRTLPSAVSGLWNLSYLMKEKPASPGYYRELAQGLDLLRQAAEANGEYFPDTMTITGGQALDDDLIARKEAAI
ncbi:MAG: hypothetical protein IJ727_11495, partial [Treponema sp.]|nr:hypothetical protein [Treponema sp.]